MFNSALLDSSGTGVLSEVLMGECLTGLESEKKICCSVLTSGGMWSMKFSIQSLFIHFRTSPNAGDWLQIHAATSLSEFISDNTF